MSKYKKMKQLIADMRLPEYRYKQLLDAVFLQGIMRFEDMKLLPKTLREKLVEQFGETVVEIKAIHHEKSMQTDKVLFGNIKNSVNYPACDVGKCSEAARVCVCHKNIPNMITQFTGAFASKGINVSDMVSKSKGDYAYSVFDISEKADEDTVKSISSIDGVLKVRVIQ